MAQIKFGTDGWRAVIAEDFTFANVASVAQAAADYWKAESGKRKAENKIVVGYDRRFLSDRFAQITTEVLAGNHFQVVLTPEPTPTPAPAATLGTVPPAIHDLRSPRFQNCNLCHQKVHGFYVSRDFLK